MPHEIIESFSPRADSEARLELEIDCKIGLIRSILGPEPDGTKLCLEWLDDDFDSIPVKHVHFPAICLTWEPEQDSLSIDEEAYVERCRDLLLEIDDLVSFGGLWDIRNKILAQGK